MKYYLLKKKIKYHNPDTKLCTSIKIPLFARHIRFRTDDCDYIHRFALIKSPDKLWIGIANNKKIIIQK